ncbi:LysR family transcriptional regulator [Mesorhizobium sp. SB112]|uniref:LysR family transcriptional regulator n=1 Tax=Mesorhizobium sp. SB112 TaxID=3151853 RepID=UPI00326541B7
MSREISPGSLSSSGLSNKIAEFDLRALRYVLAAAEAASIRRAAEAIGVEPSSVSRGIRDFEDRIGVGVFDRGPFGVRLTNAGKAFLQQAMPAIQQINEAFELAGAAGRVETGTVRVGLITTLASGFLRQLVGRFKDAHPNVAIDFYDGGRPTHIQGIRTRKLDIGIFTGNGAVEACDTLELWRERVHIAMPLEHRLARQRSIGWQELRDERFIVSRFGAGPEIRDYIVRRICDYSTYPLIDYCGVQQETLMHMVAMGKGITPVVAAWSDISISALTLVPLDALEDVVPFSAVWSPDNDNPGLRRLLVLARMMASELAE